MTATDPGVSPADPHFGHTAVGQPVHAHLHHYLPSATSADRFNSRFGLGITKSVGTMWCAYIFAMIGVMGVAGALTNNVKIVLIVGAVSGYFLQLVLLPIIIVGQDIQGKASDARAAKTFEDAEESKGDLVTVIDKLDVTTEGGIAEIYALQKRIAEKLGLSD